MSVDPAIFRALVAQGATPEMLLAVVEADAAVQEVKRASKREGNAARQRRFKAARKTGNEGNALSAVTERDRVSAPPNEYISNPPENSGEAKASPSLFAEKVVEAWNSGPAANGALRSVALTAKRRKHLAARLREHGEDGVFAAIRGVAKSDWHCGKGSNGWRSDLGWLLENPERFVKAMERAGDASAETPTAKPMNDADRAAYLVKLNDNPMFSGTRQAPAAVPRTGNTGPPRPIGDLIHLTGAHR